MELCLETIDCAEHLFAVLLENLLPEGRIAGRDTRGVTKTAASELFPLGLFVG